MRAKQYIIQELEKLKQSTGLQPETDREAQIVRLLLSKKFRKYSANEILIQHIRDSVHECVSKNQPINITFLHGAYKLWRLDESPEADWAELFALMYYSKYVKTICEIYQPGVWFDLFLDDWIIEILNNITTDEISTYLKSYQNVVDFLKPYQPNNLNMTITPVSSRFESREKFNELLEESIAATPLSELSESLKTTIELNVRPTNNRANDSMWREKNYQVHNAYRNIKINTGYHANRLDKILAFNQPVPSGEYLSLGTTKSSIAKFWAGVGVLKPEKDTFKMIILTPKQLETTKYHWEDINIGLSGKNFSKIRVME